MWFVSKNIMSFFVLLILGGYVDENIKILIDSNSHNNYFKKRLLHSIYSHTGLGDVFITVREMYVLVMVATCN